MFRIVASLAVVVTFVVSLQGCNGTYGNNISYSPCVLPSGLQAALAYPAPNFTGNSPNLSQVIIATSGVLSSSWNVILSFPVSPVYGSGRFGNTVMPASSPFPTPFQSPSFSNPNYYSSAFPGGASLPPGTIITASLNDTSSTCSPGVSLASFST